VFQISSAGTIQRLGLSDDSLQTPQYAESADPAAFAPIIGCLWPECCHSLVMRGSGFAHSGKFSGKCSSFCRNKNCENKVARSDPQPCAFLKFGTVLAVNKVSSADYPAKSSWRRL
jgi:hypothetical protein